MKNVLALDIGGTKIDIGLVNQHNKLIWQKQYSTNCHQGGQMTLNHIIKIIDRHYSPDLSAICLAIAGQVDSIKKEVFFSPHFPKSLQKTIRLGKILKQKFHLPIFMDNDANCFTLGESYYGQGKQSNYVLGLTIGTGLGSSLVINKRVYRGHHNGIELGHILIKRNHSLKHLEYYLSGTGLTNLYLQKKKQLLSTTEIIKRAQKKELIAQASLKEFYDYLKLGIINAILGFDPDIVIVGGGISQTDLPWKKIFQEIKQSIPLPIYQQVKIVCSKAPNKMTLLGVSLLTKKY
ncbi:MAG: ROK family protein [Candidatus Aenigmarchaeota archaeon]|nr:ROK family protein [Candidatus Aenigmarchaeota archaeon]